MAPWKRESRIKRALRWGGKLSLKILFILFVLTVIQVLLLRFMAPPFTARTAWDWFRNKVTDKHYKMPSYHWRRINDISLHLRKAVLAGEDQRFLSHNGFDFVELDKAIRDIIKSGRIRGASTITMQVARTVFLWHGREDWLRKITEAYYTVLIELFWSKERILEMYLNTVDWGSGVMGAEAASEKYFHISAYRLTPYQAALMAAILPSPHKWSPNNPSRYVRLRQKRIMKDMAKMPRI